MTDKIFEVLVYTHPEDQDGCIGESDQEFSFDTEEQAQEKYDSIKNYSGKQLMKYASLEPDADGDVICEDWKSSLCVCQDGNKWYVQEDPESENYVAEFNTEAEADQYVKLLEKENDDSIEKKLKTLIKDIKEIPDGDVDRYLIIDEIEKIIKENAS